MTEEAVAVAQKKSELLVVPISSIRENPVALRGVNRTNESYLGLVDSIKEKGFFGAITGRRQTDNETNEEYFELIDGLHRYAASKDAGLTEININVVDLNKDQVLEAQIMANIHKVETRPVEYSQQLKRILVRNPLMTEAELATKLGKSTQWIKERLGLTKIADKKIQDLIDEGKVNLSNAYALAKLPSEDMADFLDRAMTLVPKEFLPQVNKRAKEIRDAKRKGENAKPAEFQPVAFMQKLIDIKAEREGKKVSALLCKGLKTVDEAFSMALDWILHLDPQSVKVQKAKDEERKKVREEAKKKREAEKEAKKAEKQAKKAAKAAKEAEAATAKAKK